MPVIPRVSVFVLAFAAVMPVARHAAAETTQPPIATPQQAGKPGAIIPPSQFAAARDLVIATGLSRSFDATIKQLSQQLVDTVTRTRPDLSADLGVVMQQLAPEFDKQSQTMIDNAARIYASAMTEQDLKDALAFFNSPVGKRYVSFEPLVMTNIDQVMSEWTQKVSLGMMDRVREEMKKKGDDF